MQWLRQKIPRLLHSQHVEGPHIGETGTHRHLHVVALDTPETDSHIKQLAVYVGGMGNHRYVYVTKQGQQGIQAWRLMNRQHDGGAAHPQAIEPTLSPSPSP